MKKIQAFSILLLTIISMNAFAEKVKMNFKWSPIMQYTDKDGNLSPMPVDEIAGYEIHYSIDSELKDMEKPIIPGPLGTYELELDLSPRVKPYIVQVGIKTLSTFGTKSDMSNVLSKTFVLNNPLKPQPPKALSLTITCPNCKEVKQ